MRYNLCHEEEINICHDMFWEDMYETENLGWDTCRPNVIFGGL